MAIVWLTGTVIMLMQKLFMSSKWIDRDRKKNKKSSAKKINAHYREKGKGKDSDQKKKDAQFRKSLSDLGDELMDMLNT